MVKILVVDDDQGLRDFLKIMLSREGYQVSTAAEGKEALRLCQKQKYDLVITDLKMPKVGGLELLRAIKEVSPETMVIVITAFASGETALVAMKEGAYDYLEKNFTVDELKATVRDALSKKGVKADDVEFIKKVENAFSFGRMIGSSKGMLQVYQLINKVADTPANVLILGESGTGKELVARAVHENSSRRDEPFVVINCGGIPETLLESELFGYMKGSFSGAYTDKAGLFEVARKGTIFLDEIGELSPFLQVKLLRVVQEKTIRRIGGVEDFKVDVRILSATNRNLEEKVEKEEFREDLFYRLNVIPIRVPPLRERRDDIPLLIDFFIRKYSGELGKEVKKISAYALELLMDYPFPGNVRELENIIERSIALEATNLILPENLIIHQEGITGGDLMAEVEIPEDGINLSEEVNKYETMLIRKALEKARGSKTKAAKYLNENFDSLRYKIKKLGIK